MSDACRNWLVCLFACAVLGACDEDSSTIPPLTNVPRGPSAAAVDASTPEDEPDASSAEDAGEDREATGEKPDDKPRDTTGPQRPTNPGEDDPEPPAPDAGTMGAAGSSSEPEPPRDFPPIAGTSDAAGCYTYTPASGGMCSGSYCGITLEQLEALAPANRTCGDLRFACEAEITGVTTTCARNVKLANLSLSDEALRPLVRDCVNENEEIRTHLEPDCLDCYLEAIECSSAPCLIACLQGDSPNCDQCARREGCLDRYFTCTGLPSPF